MLNHKDVYRSINESLVSIYEGKSKFSIGDKVKINLKNNRFDGKTGVITKVIPTKSRTGISKYKVQIDGEKIAPLIYMETELLSVK